ncbi:MAG: DUF1552 domain-containing protein [Rhizobiaceae bacterium]
MLTRRNILKAMAVGTASTVLPQSLPSDLTAAAPQTAKGPKRIIFYLQQHGFFEGHALPKNGNHGDRLADIGLPGPLAPLAPYADKMNIINGLHGLHIKPGHGSFYGCLGGFRKVRENPPAATIDAVIRNHLPEATIPQVSVGFDSLARMQNRPVHRALTAVGPGKAEPMVNNPVLLYKTLFGIVSKDTRAEFTETIKSLELIEREAKLNFDKLSSVEQVRREPFVAGCRYLADLRNKLADQGDHLAKFAPEFDARFTDPKDNLEWHDALLDVAMGALKSGITNVLNIAPGGGDVSSGNYAFLQCGLGGGHYVGHQEKLPIFAPIHTHNANQLVRIIKELEATPEGAGTMMDSTLIIYASDCGNNSHSKGDNWPLVTLGNFGGKLTMGNYIDFPKGKKPLNAFYNTLLHAVGVEQDYFNMDLPIINKYDAKPGPLEELLA